MSIDAQSALEKLKTLSKKLADKNRKTRDKADEALTRKLDAAIRMFDPIVARDTALKKTRATLENDIKAHNASLSKASGEARSLASELSAVAKTESDPRLFYSAQPLVMAVATMAAQQPI